ncbi:MAG: 50S ribosomal protein L5 [Thermoprotei archaeon]|nr:50S ribosomal protein L5 [Thermoprotei archaeon]
MSALTPEVVERILEEWKRQPMRRPRISKVTLNMGIGQGGEKLAKALKVLEQLTGRKPVPRRARKTIRDFGVRKGENIGAIVTLRGEDAVNVLRKTLEAVGYRIKASSLDNYGNVCFGIPEHIQIPGMKYDPEIGIFGLDVCITIQRPGYRVALRRRAKRRIPERHRVTREEAMVFLSQTLKIVFT